MDDKVKAMLEDRLTNRFSRAELRQREKYKSQMYSRILKFQANRKEDKMVEFAKGVKIKTVKTQYGEIIKVGINVDEFMQNPINDRSYINFDILTAKDSGNKYAALDTYKKES